MTNKAVSKWESGSARPTLATARLAADALGVTVDELAGPGGDPPKRIMKIVITGGPCAGKTTAMSWIQNAFSRQGWQVLFVDETATELITGGASPGLSVSARHWQRHLIDLQLAKEKAFTDIARGMKGNKALVVCDRGAMDSRAYMTEAEFRWVLRQTGLSKVALRDGYDAVFHLVTAAKGAEDHYTLKNNAARRETPEEAAALDDRLIGAWTGHPHLRVIDNSTDFEGKMLRLIREIAAVLGEPEPTEIERKFLIVRPDPAALEARLNCEKVDIMQTYLIPEAPGEEVRVRQRGSGGHYICYMTRKSKARGMKRVEVEKRLSREEYMALLMRADPKCRPIRKTRYCLSENGLYYEIDIYPDWKDRAVMEIELSDEKQPIVFPEGIDVIREVTGEEAFTNRALARIE